MRQFRFLYRMAIRQSYAEGSISTEQHDILMDALRRPRRRKILDRTEINLMDEIENYTMENLPKSGNVIVNIVEWLKAHWQDILKIIMALLPLFLAEPEQNEQDVD